MNIYLSIGNSDDKLSQYDWSQFATEVDDAVRDYSSQIHGTWYSLPNAPWQNANWCFEVPYSWERDACRASILDIAKRYHQDSIAWLEGEPEFLRPT